LFSKRISSIQNFTVLGCKAGAAQNAKGLRLRALWPQGVSVPVLPAPVPQAQVSEVEGLEAWDGMVG